MKKVVIAVSVLLLMCFVIPAMGQTQLGVIAGLNLANISLDPSDGVDLSNRTAFGVGAVAAFPLSPMFAIQLEPTYMQKGAGADFTEGNEKYETTIKADYIDVPVMAKISFGESTTKPYIMAGPYIGFLLSAKQKLDKATVDGQDVTDQIPSSEREQDIKDFVKSTDFGLNFGAGVSFPMGNNSLFLEAQYSLGLSDINDDPDDPDTKIKNKGIQVKAGIMFPLGQ